MDIIIIGMIAVLVVVGIMRSKKSLKGGGCCGSGSAPIVKEKKLDNVIGKKTVIIEGMTCDHCKSRVTQAINDMDGASAIVSLNKKEAVVSMEKEISDEQLRETIEKAGYTVVEII